MDKNTGGVNKVHCPSFFGNIGITDIEDLTYESEGFDPSNIDYEVWRQLLCLTLSIYCTQNALNVATRLNSLDGIEFAEVSFFESYKKTGDALLNQH
jgi:hypothetical protein